MLKCHCGQLLLGGTHPASMFLVEMHSESMLRSTLTKRSNKVVHENSSPTKPSRLVYFSHSYLGTTPTSNGVCSLCYASISFCILVLIKTNIICTFPSWMLLGWSHRYMQSIKLSRCHSYQINTQKTACLRGSHVIVQHMWVCQEWTHGGLGPVGNRSKTSSSDHECTVWSSMERKSNR